MLKKTIIIMSGLLLMNVGHLSYAGHLNKEGYCIAKGGEVEIMVAEFGSDSSQQGVSRKFCNFERDGGFISIGLTAFASETPTIAATFIKTLPAITEQSPLFEGNYSNPSLNVCKNLGGASISFNVASGGFRNHLGDSDICVFGDGSMVSAWSLIYLANGRSGYDEVKQSTRAKPLRISY